MARCYAKRMGVMPQDLDDVVQETFLVAFGNGWADLGESDARRTHAVKWAARQAVRNILGIPRLGRFRLRAITKPLHEGMARARRVSKPEDVEAANILLESVKPREREMLLARGYGETFAEIGEAHGISRQRVHQILSRARTSFPGPVQSR